MILIFMQDAKSSLEYPAIYSLIQIQQLRDKSPITWCTVYLPNDEEIKPMAYTEIAPKRSVAQISSDPMLAQREVYAPMVFSAPFDIPEGEPVEEDSVDVEDSGKYGSSITDDSGVCDWLKAQQSGNIQGLIQEFGVSIDDMLPGGSNEVSTMPVRPDAVSSNFTALDFVNHKLK